jgi:Histidine kinase
MSAVLPQASAPDSGPHGVARWIHAWSRMGTRHAVAWLLASALMSVVDATALLDKLDKPGVSLLMAFDMLSALVIFGATLLAWVAATDGAPTRGHARNVRVGWAIVIGAVAAAFVLVPLMRSLEIDKMWWELYGKVKPQPPLGLVLLGNSIHFLAWSALYVAAAEVMQRRSLTNEAIRTAQREHATLSRDVLESRLAAMQAQVEPQFLFDTLVDIEHLYQKDTLGAAENLDRLITYLRVALPRLREAGSTMAAEIELVEAYLDVVRSLRNGSPALTVSLADDCREARFYPMLLLPLVQRAVRGSATHVPTSIRIGVQRAGNDIAIVLRVAAPGGCAEDREIARVRERLTGLYGSLASLDCLELHGDTTQITMRIPGTPKTANG